MIETTKTQKPGPPSIRELEDFEEDYGLVLPEDYRQFLLYQNGGEPTNEFRNVFLDGCREPICDIHYFYGIHAKTGNRLSLQCVLNIYDQKLQENMIPIARDSFGNLILLGLENTTNYGSIYFWDHESECGRTDYSNLTWVSSSFGNFENCLGKWHIPENPQWVNAIADGELDTLMQMVQRGLNVNVQYDGKMPMEYAAINARDDIITYLNSCGASLGDSLNIAKMNTKYSLEHNSTVRLLQKLSNGEH